MCTWFVLYTAPPIIQPFRKWTTTVINQRRLNWQTKLGNNFAKWISSTSFSIGHLSLRSRVAWPEEKLKVSSFNSNPASWVSVFSIHPQICKIFFFVCYGNVRIFNLVVCFDCFLFQILDLILLKQRSIKQTRAKTLHPWNIAFSATHVANSVSTVWLACKLAGGPPLAHSLAKTMAKNIPIVIAFSKRTPRFLKPIMHSWRQPTVYRCVLFV